MNAHSVESFEIAPPPPRRRVQCARARTCLGRLIEDPERTEQVFELIDALAGNDGERLFQRFVRQAQGRALLRERPSLLDALRDLPALERMPADSFGRAYARFMREGELSADGLVQASDEAERENGKEELDPQRQWFYERLRDMHDLWHVLTGYGRDVAGEAANLAFTYGQIRNRGIGVIVLAAAALGPRTLDLHWQRYLWRAWRRGRRAAMLPAARYEELLPLPLDEVRRRLDIAPPETAHPGGILVADGDEVAAFVS